MAPVTTTQVFSCGTMEAPESAMKHRRQKCLGTEEAVQVMNIKTATGEKDTLFNSLETIECLCEEE